MAGEISPSYLCESSVPERVAAYRDDMKIIVSFRDPVVRALSNHRHEVRSGHLPGPDLSFEFGLANNPMYIEQGLYAKHLERWLDVFPAEQIHVVLMDDVVSHPGEVARDVYRFLGVDSTFDPPSLTTRKNRSFAHRSSGLARIKDQLYGLTRSAQTQWLWRIASLLGIRSLYRRVNVVDSSEAIPPPREETIEHLRQTFLPDVEKLAALIDRPLDGWCR